MSSSAIARPAAISPLICIQIELGSLPLAVPIDRVEKVVPKSAVVGQDAGPAGIIYYGDTAVTLLDLQQHLLPASLPTTAEQTGYFLIVRATQGGLVAVPISTTPNLVELPQTALKALPPTYRQANLLGIASHVARIEEQTVFILDVDYLVTQWHRKP
ncbi:MAG: chemotaxis protein CheW [Cyanobacteria bacterium P01_A01_bin.105]